MSKVNHRDWDAYLRCKAIALLASRVRTPGMLLDVGCGSDTLARIVRRYVVGVDLELQATNARNFYPVRASGLALPFEERQFPIVVCSDVIEHLSLPDRKSVIHELLRVTGDTLIVSFPSGTDAFAQDVNIKHLFSIRGSETPSWLNEHLRQRYPTPEDVIELVRETDPHASVMVRQNFNLRLRRVYYWLATAGSKTHYRATRLLFSNIVRILPGLCSLGNCYRKAVVVTRGNATRIDS